jgi:hypothetical protein
VEISLDRGGVAAEPFGDLGDRQLFELAEVARNCDGAPTLDHSVVALQRGGGAHAYQVLQESALALASLLLPTEGQRRRSSKAGPLDGGGAAVVRVCIRQPQASTPLLRSIGKPSERARRGNPLGDPKTLQRGSRMARGSSTRLLRPRRPRDRFV